MKAYFKDKGTRIIFDILFMMFFIGIIFLNGVSLKDIIYPLFVCTVIWLVYMIIDLIRYLKIHDELQLQKKNIDIVISDFSEPKTQMQKDYQELLCELNNKLQSKIAQQYKINSETTEFITTWAHQIKTPLTASSLIIQGVDSGENLKLDLIQLKNELFEIEQYVDMMLQYTKLESVNSDLLLKEYNLMSIVKQSIKYFSRIFISKNISLKLDDFNDVKVVTDEKWMVFVLKQIISNALKYTKKGSIHIYMKDTSGNILVIEDTGIGISSEDLSRVFERGFTGINGRMDKKSTGIGLYLSKEILTKLNHKINIISTVGVGTRVEINIDNLTNM